MPPTSPRGAGWEAPMATHDPPETTGAEDSWVDVDCCAGADSALVAGVGSGDDEEEDAEADELLPDADLAVAGCPCELDDGALLAGRSGELELRLELPARLLALGELLLELAAELVDRAAVRAPEPVEAAPLDFPEKACAATSARTPVSARLAAISQRLARPKRRRAASRVWVVCWRIAGREAASACAEGGAPPTKASLRLSAKCPLTAVLESSSNAPSRDLARARTARASASA